MQIIKNWADIEGIVIGYGEVGVAKSYILVEVKILSLNDVPGFANLIHQEVGQVITVNCPEELVKGLSLRAGLRISFRVRKAQYQQLFIHKDSILEASGEE